MLARIARMEPALLYPVEHGSQEAQQDLLCTMWRSTGGTPVYSNTRQRKVIMTPEDAIGKRFAVVAIFAHPRG
ncbi:MAG TPA: hypothetical protein VGH08_09740 [Chthoniobacterales bacterium]